MCHPNQGDFLTTPLRMPNDASNICSSGTLKGKLLNYTTLDPVNFLEAVLFKCLKMQCFVSGSSRIRNYLPYPEFFISDPDPTSANRRHI